MDMVKSLRCTAYQETKIVPPPEVLSDEFDKAPNTRVFLLCENRVAVGTIRVSSRNAPHDPPTPFSGRFASEIARQVGERSYIEITRLAVCHCKPVPAFRYALALMQNGTAEADRIACKYVLAPIRDEHLGFYSGMGFQIISEPRLFPGWPASVTLACLDWSVERSRLRSHRHYGRLFSVRNEEA